MSGDPAKLDALLELSRELYVDAGAPYGPADDDDAVRRWVFDAASRSSLMPELELRLLAMEQRLSALERSAGAQPPR
jgi:hypothetical protein